jgi:hypothetical protein
MRDGTLGKSETEVLGYRGHGATRWVSLSRHTSMKSAKNPLPGDLLLTFPLHQIAHDRDATPPRSLIRHRPVMGTKLPANGNRGCK